MKIFGIEIWWSTVRQTQKIPKIEFHKHYGHIGKLYYFNHYLVKKKIANDIKQFG